MKHLIEPIGTLFIGLAAGIALGWAVHLAAERKGRAITESRLSKAEDTTLGVMDAWRAFEEGRGK
jgi:hypothetical protein